ncbi:MAG: Gfo/Idh/MocA family oxidoreductase [Ignavibacteria bacterium]|nr:Gfo/Idh/MocA family oxidoreductase [Ignavibacteria bacterium]
MAEKLRLGVIGMSEGNGHPYSWSAIFNGYNSEYMKDCPFPVIPDYLSKQKFPDDGLSHLGNVNYIWTQEKSISEHIAKASKIQNICDNMEDMIGNIDALLLARDDGENHLEMSLPFLKAGIPIFIDKPFATTISDAQRMLNAQQNENQIYTCSSLRFAKELILTDEDKEKIGNIKFVEGSVMKKWSTYAIHILEPLISQLPNRGELSDVKAIKKGGIHQVLVNWKNISAYLKVTGNTPVPLEIKFFGDKGSVTKIFHDSYNAFKSSLENFVNVINGTSKNFDRNETMEIVTIIEKGMT